MMHTAGREGDRVETTCELVRFLRERGAGEGVTVGLEWHAGDAEDGEAHVAERAVTMTGARCVRLDPSVPPDRRRDLAADAGVRFVLSRTDACYEVPALPLDLVWSAVGWAAVRPSP